MNYFKQVALLFVLASCADSSAAQKAKVPDSHTLEKIWTFLATGNINHQDKWGWSALHQIAGSLTLLYSTPSIQDADGIIKILVDAKADLNIKDHTGSTPLNVAVNGAGNYAVARSLLRAKASAIIKDPRGLTPRESLENLLQREPDAGDSNWRARSAEMVEHLKKCEELELKGDEA